MGSNPLVSVLIYNYNYGKYLKECVESVLNQTYKNIEIIFSDNASEDNSWEIINELVKKYPDKITITRNRKNFGSGANLYNCYMNIRGKYYVVLTSDDVMDKDFVKKCVEVLETYPNVGYVITHRLIIDENSNKTYEKPFYKHSCIIPKKEQSKVYMMSGVNPSISQVMYRVINDTNYTKFLYPIKSYTSRLKDFYLSLNYDVAYLKESLLYHRIHSSNDYKSMSDNLLEVVGHYVLIHQYVELAQIYEAQECANRYKQAIYKNATLSLRYSLNALLNNDEELAKRYFYLALAQDLSIQEEDNFKKLKAYFEMDENEKKAILKELKNIKNFSYREVSYDIPKGSIIIE